MRSVQPCVERYRDLLLVLSRLGSRSFPWCSSSLWSPACVSFSLNLGTWEGRRASAPIGGTTLRRRTGWCGSWTAQTYFGSRTVALCCTPSSWEEVIRSRRENQEGTHSVLLLFHVFMRTMAGLYYDRKDGGGGKRKKQKKRGRADTDFISPSSLLCL